MSVSRRADSERLRRRRRLVGAGEIGASEKSLELRAATQRERAADARALISRLRAIASDPHLVALADHIDRATERDHAVGGRPRNHPTWALVLFGSCVPVFGSASATARNLADGELWAILVDCVRPHLPSESSIPPRGPSRDQWQYFTSRRVAPHLHSVEAVFEELAAARALQVGLLDARSCSISAPDRTHVVGIDGKVFTSPLRTEDTERVDRRTGEIKAVRSDPARHLYAEGGVDGFALGTKFAIASTRSPIVGHRVVLGIQHVKPGDGRGEASAFTDLMRRIAAHKVGIAAYVTDGALRGTHIADAQSATGSPVVSPPRRRTAKGGGLVIDRYGYAARPLPASRARDNAFATCSGHDLLAAGGGIFERIITANGTPHFAEITRGQLKRQRLADGSYAFYARHELTCFSDGTVHAWWEPLTPTRSDTAAGFNRCEYLRALPAHHPGYARIYGMRADTESLNAELELAFHKGRLPAWGAPRQTVVVLFACLAQNAWALHVWTRQTQRQQAPPGNAA